LEESEGGSFECCWGLTREERRRSTTGEKNDEKAQGSLIIDAYHEIVGGALKETGEQ